MKGDCAGFILLLTILLVPFVSASFIAMQITMTTDNAANYINVTNDGDEEAHHVQLVSTFLDEKYESEIKDKLEPEESFSTILRVNLSNKIAGNYPLLTTVHYEDANGYPFSALLASLVKTKKPSRSGIALEAESAEITDKSKIKVTVKNLGAKSKDINLFLFISDEFVVKDNTRSITVGSKQSENVVFEVENLGARINSKYTFYVIAEYDEAGKHHSSLAPNTIEVKAKRTLFDTKIILIVLALIVIIIIAMQFRKRK